MGTYDDTVEVSRKTMVLFFLVDTSGSMDGTKIGTVNTAIEDALPVIKDSSANNVDAKIKIAVLEFSCGAQWLTPAPVEIENYQWNYLNASGSTDFGEACNQLNEKLSRKEFMNEAAGSFAPAIFLLSDGAPTDEYKQGIAKLQTNNWFKKAIKVAIAIGDDADTSMLQEFTGNSETVLTVHTPEALSKMIKFVSVRASEIGSKSASVGTAGGTTNSQSGVHSKVADFLNTLQTADPNDSGIVSGDADQW